MSKLDPSTQLKDAIRELENRRTEELYLVKEHLYLTYESLSPLNMVKNALQRVVDSQQVRKSLLDVALSAATGYVSRKIFVGSSRNPIRWLLGSLVQNEVSGIVSKNATNIEWSVMNLLSRGLAKLQKRKANHVDN